MHLYTHDLRQTKFALQIFRFAKMCTKDNEIWEKGMPTLGRE